MFDVKGQFYRKRMLENQCVQDASSTKAEIESMHQVCPSMLPTVYKAMYRGAAL
jgi:hypothetical protein